MKEWIAGRNPVFEVLRARRRQVYRLLVADGVQSDARLDEIARLAAARKVKAERVQRRALDPLAENHQGVAIEVSEYPYAALEDILERAKQRGELPFVLLLDLIQNPQNLGTLLRSADAAGVHGAVIPPARAAGVTPAVVHASVGACEHLPVAQVNLHQAITRLQEEGLWVVGLEGGADAQPWDRVRLDGALAIVVGNEGEGMRPLVRKSCDALLALPMRGQIESLNAAVAGSIVLYRALQAREERARKA